MYISNRLFVGGFRVYTFSFFTLVFTLPCCQQDNVYKLYQIVYLRIPSTKFYPCYLDASSCFIFHVMPSHHLQVNFGSTLENNGLSILVLSFISCIHFIRFLVCCLTYQTFLQERIRIGKELLEAKKMEELNERKRLVLSFSLFYQTCAGNIGFCLIFSLPSAASQN